MSILAAYVKLSDLCMSHKEMEQLGAKLLTISKPNIHGSITLHYAHGCVKKIIFTETKDL
jgi:hypothetical protein